MDDELTIVTAKHLIGNTIVEVKIPMMLSYTVGTYPGILPVEMLD